MTSGTARPAVLIQHAGGGWREPGVTAYSDEEALERLLEQTPKLLPGLATGPVAVVRQLRVPETGAVDLFAVGADGALTIVECKLQSNPDIRRRVVGQVVAYAAGLWRLSFEELDAAFSARVGKTLSAAIAAAAEEVGGDFEEAQFREAVSDNLAVGRFRLIIAVDAITEELKRIVEYLNDHTDRDVEIIAFEVGYAAEGDIELLIPAVYGQEAARRKAAERPTKRWDEQALRRAVEEWCSQQAAAGLLTVYEHALSHPAMNTLYFGEGKHPSVTAWFEVASEPVAVWSIYTDPARTVLAINFEWMHRGGKAVPAAALERLADRLRPLPGVAALYSDLAARNYKKRPSIPANQLFTADDAAVKIIEAVDELIGTGSSAGQRPPAS